MRKLLKFIHDYVVNKFREGLISPKIMNGNRKTSSFESMKHFLTIICLVINCSLHFSTELHTQKNQAREGDPEAAYQLGLHYSGESSNEQNWDYAVYWFYHAALKGHQKAQMALSLLMKKGVGLPINEEESRRWLNKAAHSGFAPAQVRVAESLERGDGRPQDLKQAVEWYTQAADQGDPEAQTVLCRFYEIGEGVPQDRETAIRLCRIAAMNDYASAQYHLGRLYLERFKDPGDFQEALMWMHKASDQGHQDAQTHLATFYREGIGVQRDYTTAKHLLQAAASQGNARAAQELSDLILNYGPQTATSSREAFDWLKVAADAGSSQAATQLANQYRNGTRADLNMAYAAEWANLATELKPIASLQPSPGEIYKSMGTRQKRAFKKRLENSKPHENPSSLETQFKETDAHYTQARDLREQIVKVNNLLGELKKKGGFFQLQAFRNQILLAKTAFQTSQDDLGLHLLRALETEVLDFIGEGVAKITRRIQVPESMMTYSEMQNLHKIWTGEMKATVDQTRDGFKVLLEIAQTFFLGERYRSAMRFARSCLPADESEIKSIFWDQDHALNKNSKSLLGHPLESPRLASEVQAFIKELEKVQPLNLKATSAY